MEIRYILHGLFGIAVLLAIAFLLSNNRRRISPRVVIWGLGLQFLFALIVLTSEIYSWIGMFIFLAMILVYMFENVFWQKAPLRNRIGLGALSAAGLALLTFLILWADQQVVLVDRPGWVVKVLIVLSLLVLLGSSLIRLQSLRLWSFTLLLISGYASIVRAGLSGQELLGRIAAAVTAFLKLTDKGSQFLFGNLANEDFFFTGPDAGWPGFGFQFAFIILPTIIFFSAFMSILYHLGVMQFIVEMMARFMRWTMRTSGAETLSCSANVFVGQTEAPLLIRPFLAEMTKSELHAIMVGGFATIAGGVLAGYIRLGVSAEHLIAASLMSAPAALVMAKILFPETEISETSGEVKMAKIRVADNILDAAARGVTDGLHLALNVGAMLIAFIALIEFVDVIFGFLDARIDGGILNGVAFEIGDHEEYRGLFPGSLRTLFGNLFGPLAWAMGVTDSDEMLAVGNLLGLKISANEFVAYLELSQHIQAHDLTPRAIVISTYALCGFANFASIGIQIGGISALVPERRSDLAKVALRAMAGGALASWMTATIAGMLLGYGSGGQ